jgi:hypothetical protein
MVQLALIRYKDQAFALRRRERNDDIATRLTTLLVSSAARSGQYEARVDLQREDSAHSSPASILVCTEAKSWYYSQFL